MMTFSPQKQKFIDSATDLFGAGSILTNKQVEDASYSAGIPKAGWFKKKYNSIMHRGDALIANSKYTAENISKIYEEDNVL